jgi:hypothetical protein
MTEMRTGRLVTGLMGSQVGRVRFPPASITALKDTTP